MGLAIDTQDIKDAIKGDVKSFKRIFDFYLPRMRPVCMRYCKAEEDTDDILQESFIKIFYNLKSFKFEGSFEGWIRKTVVNTALNHYKKNKNKFPIINIEDLSEDNTPEDEEVMPDQLEPQQLKKMLEQLPEGYKMVFTLYVLDDYSHKEIADMLGISEGSSRSQFSKAKKFINKLMLRQRNENKSSLISRTLQK